MNVKREHALKGILNNFEYWESEISQNRKQHWYGHMILKCLFDTDDIPTKGYWKMTSTQLQEIIREKGLKVKKLING